MISEWEKQILAYCIRVSRGAINTGMIKMSIFPESEAVSLGGITAIQFIDIVSYVLRLQENLTDPIRRRGFKCALEIGHKVKDLLQQAHYDISSLGADFKINQHDGYGNEIHFCFTYTPMASAAIVFENIDVVELNHNNDVNQLLNPQDENLVLTMQQNFFQEFDFIDDTEMKNDNEQPISEQNKKIKKSFK